MKPLYLNQKLQQFTFYIFITGITLLIGIFEASHPTLSTFTDLSFNDFIGFIEDQPLNQIRIIVAVILGLCGLISLTNGRVGARIAIITATTGLIFQLLASCIVFFSLSVYLLLLPIAFIAYLLPIMLFYAVIGYSDWVLQHEQNTDPTFLFWLKTHNKSSNITKISFLIVIVILVLHTLPYAFNTEYENQTIIYQMNWHTSTSSHCNKEVFLEFVDAYGYRIWTCSSEISEYLLANSDNPIKVEFNRQNFGGIWAYKIAHIGDWEGLATFNGLQFSCNNVDPKCQNPVTRPPFNQPYQIVNK